MRERVRATLLIAAALGGPSACDRVTTTSPAITTSADSEPSGGDASLSPAMPGVRAGTVSSPSGDASASPDATGAATDPSEGGADATAATTAPADAGASPGWAMWPMPNGPTSGLPHPQSYDTSVTGIALDRVTGLTWQRDATVLATAQWTDATTVLSEAAGVCAELSLAGSADWRVPSRVELASLLDFRTNPAIDTSVFGATPAFYVTSSVHSLGTTTARVGEIWFGDGTNSSAGIVLYGTISPQLWDAGELQGPLAVRCVRGHGSASGPHYTIAGGTVHDNWTGLTWIQSPSAQSMLPSTVGTYCSQQSLDSGGWRAPSANELETVFGDLASPDDVVVDMTAFPGGSLGFGSRDSDLSLATDGGPIEWIEVSAGGTGAQADVVYVLPPLPGAAPQQEYWVYALCVR
ncbi:MAG: DUF1566 domain-containing protein [Polyangiaceae bacterium]